MVSAPTKCAPRCAACAASALPAPAPATSGITRVTSVAGVPLTIAFLAVVIGIARPQPRGGRSDSRLAARRRSLMLLFIINMAYHMWIGMQEIILDYVHEDKLKLLCSDGKHVLRLRRWPRFLLRHPEAFVRSLSHGEQWKMDRRASSTAAPIRSKTTATTSLSSAPAARACARWSAAGSRPAHRLHHQSVSDPLAHRRGAGRHRRRARQYGRGRLALAHVRHGQGRRLARRPGRDRISVPQRAGRRV